MKLFNKFSHGMGTIIFCPGRDHPENPRWTNQSTGEALQFLVKFNNGVAIVDADLGEYLIAHKHATRTPSI